MRLFLYLSGSWPLGSQNSIVGKNDHIFVGAGVEAPSGFSVIHKEKEMAWSQRAELSQKLINVFEKLGDGASQVLLESFLNDYFSYSLRPVFTMLLSIRECLESFDYRCVYIVAPDTSCAELPLLGFQTSESKRGSKALIGAYVGKILQEIFPAIKFFRLKVKGDALCNDRFRRATLFAANKAFSLSLIWKTGLIHRPFSQEEKTVQIESLVLIRNLHQGRFAARLLGGGSRSAAVIFPQASQGALSSLRKCFELLPEGTSYVGLSWGEIASAYRASRQDIKTLRLLCDSSPSSSITIDGITLRFSLSWLIREIERAGVVILYHHLVRVLLEKVRPNRLVNFELVGRMAALESAAARKVGVQVHSVQTALISSTPHPVFPWCDFFYADGVVTQKLIGEIGTRRKGVVVYEGPALFVKPTRSVARFEKISFFTQPYEIGVTIRILISLLSWARNTKASVTLKLHPRDSVANYAAVLHDFKDVLLLDGGGQVESLIDSSDLVVTRTSSIAKEAVGLGCPIILCQWSLFDCSVRADYIVESLSQFYCSTDAQSLCNMLGDTERVVTCASEINNKLFGDKCLSTLAERTVGS